MADVLTSEQRRFNMSRIRGRDTKPEMVIRRGLHGQGLRYRLHDRSLPGRPDLVFPKYRAVIFVHGCFWHGHDCPMFKPPSTRREFWTQKITSNRTRDEAAVAALLELGWRAAIVWECSLRGPARRPQNEILVACKNFVQSNAVKLTEISGV
jgi:DNA mismatch endonuclease (patch repair protein)